MTNRQRIYLVIVAIGLGLILVSTVEFLLLCAFWVGVGYLGVLTVDLACGLGERACAARASIRGWMNRRRPNLRTVVPFPAA